MRQLLILVLLFTFSLTYVCAQSCNSYGNYNNNNYSKKDYKENRAPQKTIFVEWQGNGIGKSINFDSRFSGGSNGLGLRVGLGATDLELSDASDVTYAALTIPAAINYIIGKRRHGIEAGVGYTTILDKNSNDHEGQAFLNLGYRFKPKRSGILFRFTYTPTFDESEIQFGKTGISLGWAF